VLTDRRSIHTFRNSAGQVRWGEHLSNVGAAYSVLPVFAGFYLAGVVADNEKARETGILSGEAILDSLIVVEGLKLAAGRNRPNAPAKPGNFFQGGRPVFLPGILPKPGRSRRSLLMNMRTGNGCRGSPTDSPEPLRRTFRAQKHYASDVIAGSAIGFFVGRFVVRTHEAHAKHHHGRLLRRCCSLPPQPTV